MCRPWNSTGHGGSERFRTPPVRSEASRLQGTLTPWLWGIIKIVKNNYWRVYAMSIKRSHNAWFTKALSAEWSEKSLLHSNCLSCYQSSEVSGHECAYKNRKTESRNLVSSPISPYQGKGSALSLALPMWSAQQVPSILSVIQSTSRRRVSLLPCSNLRSGSAFPRWRNEGSERITFPS